MLDTEGEKFDAKWSMSSQSSLDHRRDFEADPSNDNVPCTCEVEFMLPEDDDPGSDSSEIKVIGSYPTNPVPSEFLRSWTRPRCSAVTVNWKLAVCISV